MKDSKFFENTLIVVSSDHLAMRTTASELLETDDQRILWVDKCSQNTWLAPISQFNPGSFCVVYGTLGNEKLNRITLHDNNTSIRISAPEKLFRAAPASPAFHEKNLSMLDEMILLDPSFEESERIPESTLDGIIQSFMSDGIRDKPKDLAHGHVVLKSAGFNRRRSYIIDLVSGKKIELEHGLTIVGFSVRANPVKLGHIVSKILKRYLDDENISL